MSSSSKSRKLSVFDRLGPEEDLSHGSSSTTSRHSGYSGHKRDRQSKSKHHRQGYDDEEVTEKFGQQQSSSYHQSTKDRHSGSYTSSSHHYRKPSVEALPSDGSDCEDAKKEKYPKKQYGEKEPRGDYSKEKPKVKPSKTDKEVNEFLEGFTDTEERSAPMVPEELDLKEKDSLAYDEIEAIEKDILELDVDMETTEGKPSGMEDVRSADEVVEDGERLKHSKSSKEKKKKKHKTKEEEIEASDDYERHVPLPELDDQEFLSRSSKRKLADSKSSSTEVSKKNLKRPGDKPPSYRERSTRSSSKISAGLSEIRESGSWKPSTSGESYKQSELSSLDRQRDDRHRDDRHRKMKLHTVEDEYRRGRDRERDRPIDGLSDYNSRKRKRSYSPDASSKRSKRGKRDTELYDSFSEEELTGDSSDKKEKEIPAAKNDVDMDLLFLEEDDACLKGAANNAIDRYKPACVFLKTGVSTGLCGPELYSAVSDILLTHLQSQDAPDNQLKEHGELMSKMSQKNFIGLQVASELGRHNLRNKLIKDVSVHSKAMTAQDDLSVRNKLRKNTNNNQRSFTVTNNNTTGLPVNWDSELYAAAVELYKMNNINRKSKLISSHYGTVVYM